eukprot:4591610-Alexandrium_andersonii.AAC.1
MSASLVGSEMCIRDSAPPAQRTPPRVVGPPQPHSVPRVRRWGSGAIANSVSYTHLTLPTICSV